MFKKIKDFYLKAKERVYNKSGAVGAIVTVLSVFGFVLETNQITDVFTNIDTLFNSLDNLAIVIAGIYEVFRKEK